MLPVWHISAAGTREKLVPSPVRSPFGLLRVNLVELVQQSLDAGTILQILADIGKADFTLLVQNVRGGLGKIGPNAEGVNRRQVHVQEQRKGSIGSGLVLALHVGGELLERIAI